MYGHLSSLDTLLADIVWAVKLVLYNGMHYKTHLLYFQCKSQNVRVFDIFFD